MKTRETIRVTVICVFVAAVSLIAGTVKAQPELCEDDGAYVPENIEIVHGCATAPPISWKTVFEATIMDFDVFYIESSECNPLCPHQLAGPVKHGAELIVPLSAGEWVVAYQELLTYRYIIDGDEYDSYYVSDGRILIEFDGRGPCDERNFIEGVLVGRRIVANCDTNLSIKFSSDYPLILQMMIWQTKEWEPIK